MLPLHALNENILAGPHPVTVKSLKDGVRLFPETPVPVFAVPVLVISVHALGFFEETDDSLLRRDFFGLWRNNNGLRRRRRNRYLPFLSLPFLSYTTKNVLGGLLEGSWNVLGGL